MGWFMKGCGGLERLAFRSSGARNELWLEDEMTMCVDTLASISNWKPENRAENF